MGRTQDVWVANVADAAAENPNWEGAAFGYDWRHYIGPRLRQQWDSLPSQLKRDLVEDAREIASAEDHE